MRGKGTRFGLLHCLTSSPKSASIAIALARGGEQLPINPVLNTKIHLQRNHKKPFPESAPPVLHCCRI